MVFHHCEGLCGFFISLRIATYGFLRITERCFAGSSAADNSVVDVLMFKERPSRNGLAIRFRKSVNAAEKVQVNPGINANQVGNIPRMPNHVLWFVMIRPRSSPLTELMISTSEI